VAIKALLVCLAVTALRALTNGVAPALHSPFTQGLSVYVMEREGVELIGGTRGLVGFATITAALIAFATVGYTALSAVGMGVRLLAARFVSR
jgi:hypothetical protein